MGLSLSHRGRWRQRRTDRRPTRFRRGGRITLAKGTGPTIATAAPNTRAGGEAQGNMGNECATAPRARAERITSHHTPRQNVRSRPNAAHPRDKVVMRDETTLTLTVDATYGARASPMFQQCDVRNRLHTGGYSQTKRCERDGRHTCGRCGGWIRSGRHCGGTSHVAFAPNFRRVHARRCVHGCLTIESKLTRTSHPRDPVSACLWVVRG